MKRIQANPTPALLTWARRTAGLSAEVASHKANIKIEQLVAWEDGTKQPSIPQLRKLSTIYRRLLAAFYLPEPPIRFQAMQDFRRMHNAELEEVGSPKLAFEIRRAHDRREWALEMLEGIDESPPQFQTSAAITEDVEVVATRLRKIIGVSVKEQSLWRSAGAAFKKWRMLFEDAGILTLQATSLPLDEARGFSISMKPLPVVVANIKDSPRGRIFTILHEATHLMLNQGGVCDFHDANTEAFCNRVAGAALFPRQSLLGTYTVRHHRKDDPVWKDDELRDISRQFGGSREAALVRLLTLGLTTQSFYTRMRGEFVKQYEEQEKRKRAAERFAPPHVIALSSAGPLFTNLVMVSLNREKITVSDVSDLLQIRVKHLRELQGDFSA